MKRKIQKEKKDFQEIPSDSYTIALFSAELGDAPTIDLHGMTVDEAIHNLDSFLNHEFIRDTEAIRVIHGKGSGKLRETILPWLKKHELVAKIAESSKSSEYGGITYVALNIK